MHRRFWWSVGLALAGVFVFTAQAAGESTCSPDGLQESGSIYRICMPAAEDYNGHLVIWAHGFQDATEPVRIPDEQLEFDGLTIPGLANDLGFGFATNSYSKTGLAIVQGMDDLRDLVEIFTAEQGAPEKVFLVGASEGGIITTLLVEQNPETFAGGLAICGPVGDFARQINYFGDSRVTFEYFFPGLIPGDPLAPTPELAESWSEYYEGVVKPAVFSPANASKLAQWAAVAKLPFDTNNFAETLEQSLEQRLLAQPVGPTRVGRSGGTGGDARELRHHRRVGGAPHHAAHAARSAGALLPRESLSAQDAELRRAVQPAPQFGGRPIRPLQRHRLGIGGVAGHSPGLHRRSRPVVRCGIGPRQRRGCWARGTGRRAGIAVPVAVAPGERGSRGWLRPATYRMLSMSSRVSSPCLVCGEPTRCVVRQQDSHRVDRAVPLCAECITLWQDQAVGRQFLLASLRCWGAGPIRDLLREDGARRNPPQGAIRRGRAEIQQPDPRAVRR